MTPILPPPPNRASRAASHGLRLLFGLLCAQGVQAALPEEQHQALADLYHQTQGPGWRVQDRWLDGDPCENRWHGVQCNEGRNAVTGLNLPNNHLRGPLPASLKNLSQLEALDLHGNRGLTGLLPALTPWPGLVSLDVSFNEFEGRVPSFAGLPRLRRLILSNNLLSGTVPPLAQLPSLNELRLNHNRLHGQAPDLAQAPALETVDLSFNQFTGPMPRIETLPRLRLFNAEWNALQGPLPSLAGLGRLKVLILSGNLLQGPIPDLSDLTALEMLYLDHNRLTGGIPRLERLRHLSQLDLSHNALSGPLPSLAGLPQLSELQIDHNRLTGPLPLPPAGLPKVLLCGNAPSLEPEDAPGLASAWRAILQRSARDNPCLQAAPNPPAGPARHHPAPSGAAEPLATPQRDPVATDCRQPGLGADCPRTTDPRADDRKNAGPAPRSWLVTLISLAAVAVIILLWRLRA